MTQSGNGSNNGPGNGRQEAGFKDFLGVTFNGLLAPTQTPRAVIDQLNAALAKVLQDKDTTPKFEAAGTELYASSPEEFMRFMQSETDRWRRVITEANIRSE